MGSMMPIGPSNQNPGDAAEPQAQGKGKPTNKKVEHLPTPKPSREPSEVDLPDEAGALLIDPAILAQELALTQQHEIAQQEATQQSPAIQASSSSSVEEPVKHNRDRPLKRKASSSPSDSRPVKVQHVPTAAQQEWQRWHDSKSPKTPLQLQSQPAFPNRAAQAAVHVASNSLQVSNGFPSDSASPADDQYVRGDELPDVEPGKGSYILDWEEQIPGSRTNGVASDKGTRGPVSENGDSVQFHPALFLADDSVKDQQIASSSLPSASSRPIAPKPPHVPELKTPPRHPTVEKLRQEAVQSSKKHSPNGNFALLNSQPAHGSLAMRMLSNNRESQDPSFTIGPKPSQEASKSPLDPNGVSPKSRKRQRTPSLKVRENEVVVHTLGSPAHQLEQALLSAVKPQTMSTVKSPKGRKDGSVISTSKASPSTVRTQNQKQIAKDPKETGSKVPASIKIRLSTKNKGKSRAGISAQENPLRNLPPNLVPHTSFSPNLGPDEYGVFPEAEIWPQPDANQVENEISLVPAVVPLRTDLRPRSNSLSSRSGRNLPPQISPQDLPEKVRRWHSLGLETFQDIGEDGSIEHRVVTRTGKSDNSIQWWLNQLLVAVVNEHPNEDTPEDILRLMRWKTNSTVPKILRRKVQEWVLQLAPGPVVSLVPTDRLKIRSDVVILTVVSEKAESKAEYGAAALKVFGDHKKLVQKTGWDEMLECVEAKAHAMKHGRLWRRAGLGPDKVSYKEDQAWWAFREWEERLRGRGQFVEDWRTGFIASSAAVTADTANSQEKSQLARVISLGYRRQKQSDELSWMTKAEADKILLPGEQVRYRPVQVEFRAGHKTEMKLEYARFPGSQLALQRGY